MRSEVALVLNGSSLFNFMKMRCSRAKLTLWASTQCWEYADKPADGKSHTGDQTKPNKTSQGLEFHYILGPGSSWNESSTNHAFFLAQDSCRSGKS